MILKQEGWQKNKKYLFPSFNTNAGSGPNGAVIHYRATKKTNRILKNPGRVMIANEKHKENLRKSKRVREFQ